MKVTIGYIPENCAEPNVVQINEMSITYCQSADTNSSRDEEQFLTITTSQAGCGEDDIYYNISTKDCDHWSVNEPEELSYLLKDFISRLNLHITKSKELKTYEL